MSGTLFIVSTPIGNLEDISLRALRVLKEVDIIAAEDTRVTRKLLSRFDIHTILISYHQNSRGKRAEEIVGMLQDGKNVALVSDAGTPGISDPGHELIAICIAEGIRIEPIPGPSAIITALVVSGLSTTSFAFDGFPPRKENERRAFFANLRSETRTVCLYESPLRLVKTLQSILEVLGDRPVAVAREITKVHEEIFRGSVSQAIEHFSAGKVRGEVVIVLGGCISAENGQVIEDRRLESRLRELLGQGMSEKDAVRQCVIEFRLSRRRVYAAALAIKGEKSSAAS